MAEDAVAKTGATTLSEVPDPSGHDLEVADLAANLARASLVLARRFDQGATMWCASPAWPFHAAHVAVEFVHPVIMGKRALPAVLVTPGPDLTSTLRGLVRPGDIVCALGPCDDDEVGQTLRRGPAWGVETVWIGAGSTRPPSDAADHVLWLGTDEALDGSEQFVRIYHLLWELTHVCFEHPGLMKEPVVECTDEVCITCSDEGRLAEVVTVDGDEAVVLAEGQRETIDVSLIPEPVAGDLVLVHAGFAINATSADAGMGGRSS